MDTEAETVMERIAHTIGVVIGTVLVYTIGLPFKIVGAIRKRRS